MIRHTVVGKNSFILFFLFHLSYTFVNFIVFVTFCRSQSVSDNHKFDGYE